MTSQNLEELIFSELNTSIDREGQLFEIIISKSVYETLWTLKIQNQRHQTFILGVAFRTDKDAFEEASRVLKDDISSLM